LPDAHLAHTQGAAADEHPAAVDEQHRRHIDGPIEIVTPLASIFHNGRSVIFTGL
jgi:hypothetical protein